MKLTDKQQMLFEFVKFKHAGQKRKYTNEPYYNHLLNVAEIVSIHEIDCIEIALCHDLFEDTNCYYNELYIKMISIGYDEIYSNRVCFYVQELTDKFTKESFPYLNRKERKINECKRLSKISYKAKSVKYADLIDNTSSIVEYDIDFAKVYLKEKQDILKVMNNGNHTLYNICETTLKKSLNKLSVEQK